MECFCCYREVGVSHQCTGGIDLNPSHEIVFGEDLQNCPYCGVVPGSRHHIGCDIERCARCRQQATSCLCIYDVYGVGVGYDITEDMYEKWVWAWGDKRLRWTGIWPNESFEAEDTGCT